MATPFVEPELPQNGNGTNGNQPDTVNANWFNSNATNSSSVATSPSRATMLGNSVNTSNNKSEDVVRGEVVNLPSVKKNENTIDVRLDYDWTFSKNKNLRDEVPYIRVSEFKLAANTYLSSLISSIMLFPDAMKENTQTLQNAAKKVTNLVESAIPDSFKKFMDSTINPLAKDVSDFAKSAADKFKDQNTGDWPEDIKNNYEQLYIRKSTGQTYIFPYFSSEYYSQTNGFDSTFSDSNSETPLEAGLQGVAGVVDRYSRRFSLAAITEPGMYVQRPKFYHFDADGKSINVEFYLYNTLNPNSYYKNMELLTKLIIQNTPRRYSRLLVDPPCVYEVDVPGRCFYPYAFVSSLNVSFIGTKRMVGDKIVPDAFKVTIEFKSLTTEVNNFLVPNMGTGGIDVTTRYRVEGFNELFGKLQDISGINKDVIKVDAKKNLGGLDLRNNKQGVA